MASKVLIVDDSRTAVKMLFYTLHEMSLEVDYSTYPKEGLVKVSQNLYDFLILDLEMPEINGIQFLKKLQQAGITVPVIILTGKEDQRLIYGIMSQFSIVKNYLIKPYNRETIRKAIKTVLKQKG